MRWLLCVATALALAGSVRAEEPAKADPDPLLGLKAPAPRQRLEAAWKLAALRTPEAEAAWVAALGDPARPDLHFEAAARLAAFETLSAKARSALIAMRTTKDSIVRLAVDVALEETQDEAGAMDRGDRMRPGKKYFGVSPGWKPDDGAPTTFDAGALDGTLWTEASPVNILGEGSVTFITLKRCGADLVARLAHVNHHLARKRAGDGEQAGAREWVTDWTLRSGWIDTASREWRGPDAGGRVLRRQRKSVTAVPVGLVRGRLAAPALLRTKTNCWVWTGAHNETTLRFDGQLVAGQSGKAEIVIHPRTGEDVTGVVKWRVESEKGAPWLRLDRTFALQDGIAAVSPHAYLLDVPSGAAAALGRRFGASATYLFAGRVP
jgi:hypothetical protein